jgi:aspartate-semialdehyde dehydrogenase
MNLYIIGATGLVGKELISLFEDHSIENINFIASPSSKGKIIFFKNKEYHMNVLESINYEEDNVYINCSSSDIALYLREKMSENSVLIDNSSAFRMLKEIPLVIPHINFPEEKNQIFANPNCSTIILSCLLYPLRKFKFERIVVSTYQAASGAGKEGLEELELQMKQYCNNTTLTTDYWGKQYVSNCFVHNSKISDDFYNLEELKLINETRKIFNKNNLRITSTCIRVPTIRSHCESVNIEFEEEVTYDEILNLLKIDNNIIIIDDKSLNNFPDTLSSTNKTQVFVGHIRPDNSLPKNKGWNFWISGDQILRGAAYNAFEIYKKLF